MEEKTTSGLDRIILDLTISILINRPHKLIPFAHEFFEKFYAIELKETQKAKYAAIIASKDVSDFPVKYVRGRNKTVCAEPYDPGKDEEGDGNFVVVPKSEEERQMLMDAVSKCLLFRALDSDHIHKVIDVMFPMNFEPEDTVIRQYEDGDNFYVIQYGFFDVYQAENFGDKSHYVLTYENEGSFGELALMYNIPRAATVRARTYGKCWAMDGKTFRRIVLKAAYEKRKMYEGLIAKVPMLSELTNYERINLADALIPKVYKAEDTILRQGETADGMYFIEKGSVRVTMFDTFSRKTMDICKLGEGCYFGELSLLMNKPRAATVKARSKVKAAFLDVAAFERILGPCMDIMKRDAERYQQQVDDLFNDSSIMTI